MQRAILLIWLLLAAIGWACAGTQSAQAATPKRFALLIGVERYQNSSIPTLEGCANDVISMKKILKEKYEFGPGSIMTLVNEQAKRKAIIDSFETFLVGNAKRYPGSIIVFYFSGHGSTVDDPTGYEPEGFDETIVPYDSRMSGHYDILDRDLESLFSHLQPYTKNTTFILDSCHSANTLKAIGIKQIPKDKRIQPPSLRAVHPRPRDITNFGPVNRAYVLISGCQDNELSSMSSTGAGSAMTTALVNALRKANSDTTYQQLIRTVSDEVTAEFPEQHPQVEGDVRRTLFNGIARRGDAGVLVTATAARSASVDAGRAGGFDPGAIVAFYKAGTLSLTGPKGRLGDGIVTAAGGFKATASLGRGVKVAKGDAAILVAPGFGRTLRVAGSTDPEFNQQVLAALSRAEATSGYVQFVSSDARQDVALSISGEQVSVKFPDGTALYSYIGIRTDPASPNQIAARLLRLARHRNLRALTNKASNLANGIRLDIVHIQGDVVNGKFAKTGREPLPRSTEYRIKRDVRLRASITNTTSKPLYVYLIDIAPDGGVTLMYPREGATVSLQPHHTDETSIWRTGPASGDDILKLIVTSAPADFSYLQEEPFSDNGIRAARKGVPGRLLIERLIQQSLGMRKLVPSDETPDEWSTLQATLHVSSDSAYPEVDTGHQEGNGNR